MTKRPTFKLEARTCAQEGCVRSFRVMVGSPARWCCVQHTPGLEPNKKIFIAPAKKGGRRKKGKADYTPEHQDESLSPQDLPEDPLPAEYLPPPRAPQYEPEF